MPEFKVGDKVIMYDDWAAGVPPDRTGWIGEVTEVIKTPRDSYTRIHWLDDNLTANFVHLKSLEVKDHFRHYPSPVSDPQHEYDHPDQRFELILD